MTAYVIGLGRSGIAAARILKRDGWEVILSDRSSSPSLQETQQQLEAEGITVKLNHTAILESTHRPQLIVVSPGVPLGYPFLSSSQRTKHRYNRRTRTSMAATSNPPPGWALPEPTAKPLQPLY